MTPIDLRIKYKFETGFASIIDSELTEEYAKWLEGRYDKQRIYYKRDTGLDAMQYDEDCDLCYTYKYKEWLENARCEAYSVLEKLRK